MNDWWAGGVSRVPNRKGEPHSTGEGDAIESEKGPVPAAPADGYSKAAMLNELKALNALTPGQIQKVAAEISKDDAAASVKRLKNLEESAPSKGKILRGALVGGAVAPIANLALRAAAGSRARAGQPIYLGVRPQLANAAHGAIFGGLVPAGQHKLETEAEKQKLREYVGTHPRGTLRGEIKKVTGL